MTGWLVAKEARSHHECSAGNQVVLLALKGYHIHRVVVMCAGQSS
jgi:hypothetical protein